MHQACVPDAESTLPDFEGLLAGLPDHQMTADPHHRQAGATRSIGPLPFLPVAIGDGANRRRQPVADDVDAVLRGPWHRIGMG